MELLIGAHTSAAGGVHNALLEGASIGATTIQLFTSNQKQWKGKPIPQEEVALWNETLKETGLKKIMSHDSYLINLGAANPENLTKSRTAIREELERCHQLNLAFLNFHPGTAVGCTREECMDRIIESLLELKPLAAKGETVLLLECTAGQGNSVGYRFEELAYIVQGVDGKIPIGVCVDTCHAFAAGYDIRTREGWEVVLKEFDQVIGLKYLKAFHLNDSMKPLGSRVDRHAPLGKGEIGLECFRFLMTDSRVQKLPKYLETPEGPPGWKNEIQLLRTMAKEHAYKN